MIALLPITRFKVDYEVALGRPFSQFERLLLQAVVEGISTLDTLRSTFFVHRRVLIEALVTLMHAGWITIGLDGTFNVTAPGRKALQGGSALPSTLAIEPRTDFVIMERFGGQVTRKGSVMFHDRRKLASIWEMSIRLPNGDFPPNLDPSAVGPLLARDAHGWIRWINTVTPVRRGPDYVVLSVNLEKRVVSGLPKEWEQLIGDAVLDRCLHAPAELRELSVQEDVLEPLVLEVPAQYSVPRFRTRIGDVSCARIESRIIDHVSSLLDRAERHLVIAATDLAPDFCKHILQSIAKAVNRGVRIDVIYTGPKDATERSSYASEIFRKEAYNYLQFTRNIARLTFGVSHRTPLNGCLFQDSNGYKFSIYSQSILSDGATDLIEVTTRVPGMVSDVCQILGDGYGYENDATAAPAIVRLRMAAATIQSQTHQDEDAGMQEMTAQSYGDVVRSNQFPALLREFLDSASRSVILIVPSIPNAVNQAISLLGRALIERNIRIAICTADYQALSSTPCVIEEFVKCGGEIFSSSEIKQSWLIKDECEAVVGTYNWLSPAVIGGERTVSHIGFRFVDRDFTSCAAQLLGIAANQETNENIRAPFIP